MITLFSILAFILAMLIIIVSIHITVKIVLCDLSKNYRIKIMTERIKEKEIAEQRARQENFRDSVRN